MYVECVLWHWNMYATSIGGEAKENNTIIPAVRVILILRFSWSHNYRARSRYVNYPKLARHFL